MNSFSPSFMERLGLAGEVDERQVRRAYARELKQLDQETQANEFQVLREAYEAALRWCGSNAAKEANEANAVEHPMADPGQIPPRQPDPVRPDYRYRQQGAPLHQWRPAGELTAATPSVHDWLQQAQQAWQELVEGMYALTTRSEGEYLESWTALLTRTCADARMENLRARPWLERQVAELLLGGWRNGHQSLFAAAIVFFNWKDDTRSLRDMGEPGQRMALAIRQYLSFLQTPAKTLEPMHAAIARLRDPSQPGQREARKLLPNIQPLLLRYPDWLGIVTNVDNLRRWRDQGLQFPTTTAKKAWTGTTGTGTRLGFPIVLVLFLALQFIARCSGPSLPPLTQMRASTSTSTPAPETVSLLASILASKPVPPHKWTPASITVSSPQLAAPDARTFAPSRPNGAMAQRVGQLVRPHLHFRRPAGLQGALSVDYKIQLSNLGFLLRIEPNGSSGLSGYDDAVRAAIEAAQPYPTDVPREMLLNIGSS